MRSNYLLALCCVCSLSSLTYGCDHLCQNRLELINELNGPDFVDKIVEKVNYICEYDIYQSKSPSGVCAYGFVVADKIIGDTPFCMALKHQGIVLKPGSGKVVLDFERKNDVLSPFNVTVSFALSFRHFSLVYWHNPWEIVMDSHKNEFEISFTDYIYEVGIDNPYKCYFRWNYIRVNEFTFTAEKELLGNYSSSSEFVISQFEKDRFDEVTNSKRFLGFGNVYLTPCYADSNLHYVGNTVSRRLYYRKQYPRYVSPMNCVRKN